MLESKLGRWKEKCWV